MRFSCSAKGIWRRWDAGHIRWPWRHCTTLWGRRPASSSSIRPRCLSFSATMPKKPNIFWTTRNIAHTSRPSSWSSPPERRYVRVCLCLSFCLHQIREVYSHCLKYPLTFVFCQWQNEILRLTVLTPHAVVVVVVVVVPAKFQNGITF